MATPEYSNEFSIGQYTRTMTGSAIVLSSTTRYAYKAFISVPSTNTAGVTIGGDATTQGIAVAKGSTYEFEPSHADSMRVDLNKLYINGTNNDVVHVLYFA